MKCSLLKEMEKKKKSGGVLGLLALGGGAGLLVVVVCPSVRSFVFFLSTPLFVILCPHKFP